MSAGSRRRPGLILAICCLSLFIVAIDNTIVNVALPSLRRDLGASIAGLQWTVDAYTLVLAGLLMLGGSTGDRLGRRRTFQAGLVIFTAGSLLCGLAPSLGWLVGFRALQGIGGAMLNPVAMSIITNVYVEPRARARAIGTWAAVAGISLALGPVVGGVLVDGVSWRAIFWVNVPIGLAALVLTALFVPESRAPRARRFDPVGQLLVMLVLVGVTYAIIEAPAAGWGSREVLLLLAGSLAGSVAFVGYERRRPDPLIEPRFFGSAPFSGAAVIAIAGFAALSGFLFLNTFYLQEVRGFSALRAGLSTLPMPLTAALLAPLAGRLVGARGTRIPLAAAGAFLAAAGAVLAAVGASTPLAELFVAYVGFGVGFGMLNAPVTATAVAGMPRSQAGVAAAVASTSRQVGQSLGVAVVGSVIAAGLGAAAGRTTEAAGLPAASHAAWWVVAGSGAAVLVVGLLTSGAWARRTAERTAARLPDDGGDLAAGAVPSRAGA